MAGPVKRVFVSFADSRYAGSRRRILQQARALQFYDEIFFFSEYDLSADFRKRFSHALRPEIRGFGYWCWKPQVILQALERVEPGDIIQYTDAGSHLNVGGRNRLAEYFSMAESTVSGVLAFSFDRELVPPFIADSALVDWPNGAWTKGDLLDYFGLRSDQRFLCAQTVQGSPLFVRKQENSIDFIREWLGVIDLNFGLVDDSPSFAPDLLGFIEHRHDQAILSAMCHLRNIPTVSAYETYIPPDTVYGSNWDLLKQFPIQVRRDKKVGLWRMLAASVRNRIERQLESLWCQR